MSHDFLLARDAELSEYSFPNNHPFRKERLFSFLEALDQCVQPESYGALACALATKSQLKLFHENEFIDWVKQKSREGHGFLDQSDTPAFPGAYEAASRVVGTVLRGVDQIMGGATRRVFIPIAGLHHGKRAAASGFCIFNDCGVAIEYLRKKHGIQRIAYVDIDAHHGDGVFYAFESDPELLVVDFHEDGRFLYPGSGHAEETGAGLAGGTKLNIPLSMTADDAEFMARWPQAEQLIDAFQPEFIIMQAGADAMRGDPVTDLMLTPAVYTHATERLRHLAQRHSQGRLLVMGGGGYNLDNIGQAWTAVVKQLL